MKNGYYCNICGGIFAANQIYFVEHGIEHMQPRKGAKTYCLKCFEKYKNFITDSAIRILRKDG